VTGEVLSQRELWNGGFLSISEDTFELDSGSKVSRIVVHHPGAVVVVPVTSNGSVVAIRQFRAAAQRELVELCAGKRDIPGEPPIETARRELKEELGLEAEEIIELSGFLNSPGFCDEFSYLFLARGLSYRGRVPQSIEEAESKVIVLSLDMLANYLANGTIEDAKTIIGLFQAREFISSNHGVTDHPQDQPDLIDRLSSD
jgi:ADP-ribose pyrophosphatase